MKIGILTYHRANNYGAVLQAYALYNTCKSLNNHVEMIDYRCNCIEDVYKNERLLKFQKNIIKWGLSCCYYQIHKKELTLTSNKFDTFRNKMSMSKSYYHDNKKEMEENFDLIITGSDQIWCKDITGSVDDWYCYKKIKKDIRVISYAASAGSLEKFKNNFSEYKDILSNYDGISTREENLTKFLINNGFINSKKVLDPTLLLEEAQWRSLAGVKRIINAEYLLYYDVEENEISKRVAIDISKKENLKIVIINHCKGLSDNSIILRDCGPVEFLNLILYSKYVIGSSFHLAVFSIIFEKQFLSMLHSVTGDRIKNFLSGLGLDNRIIYKYENIDEIYNTIDYKKVKQILLKEKENSMNFLIEQINYEKCKE